jgi:SAM-dependent methyltransferase
VKARDARAALDLGCGVGRHALLLAEHGLAVEGIGDSAAGLTIVRETARAPRHLVGLAPGDGRCGTGKSSPNGGLDDAADVARAQLAELTVDEGLPTLEHDRDHHALIRSTARNGKAASCRGHRHHSSGPRCAS